MGAPLYSREEILSLLMPALPTATIKRAEREAVACTKRLAALRLKQERQKLRSHPCYFGEPELDHDWRYLSDFAGDCGVVNGTQDISCWECTRCGEQKDGEPPEYYDEHI